jgi:hypothetical protein
MRTIRSIFHTTLCPSSALRTHAASLISQNHPPHHLICLSIHLINHKNPLSWSGERRERQQRQHGGEGKNERGEANKLCMNDITFNCSTLNISSFFYGPMLLSLFLAKKMTTTFALSERRTHVYIFMHTQQVSIWRKLNFSLSLSSLLRAHHHSPPRMVCVVLCSYYLPSLCVLSYAPSECI